MAVILECLGVAGILGTGCVIFVRWLRKRNKRNKVVLKSKRPVIAVRARPPNLTQKAVKPNTTSTTEQERFVELLQQ